MTARLKRSSYQLSRSQVDTPPTIATLTWEIVSQYRKRVTRVLDLGAGDGRFAFSGTYQTYEGVEIDRRRVKGLELPTNAHIHVGCAFVFPGDRYSLCIGNPPYVRHHDLEEKWRDKTAAHLSEILGVQISRKANLYIYFLALALLKTRPDGLVAMIVPLEWTVRPSAKGLRDYIKNNRWDVTVYQFTESIFDKVETTASIAVIDKRSKSAIWRYFDVKPTSVSTKHLIVNSQPAASVPYEKRGTIWALRGMSPGTQKVFTLTEGERIHSGLPREDVMPCVTTLRRLLQSQARLDEGAFKKYFIDAGEKCWLIRSCELNVSTRLAAFLKGVPKKDRDTWTCKSRRPWYRYALHPIPKLLVSAGFSGLGPKILINTVGAHAVGAVSGIHSEDSTISTQAIRDSIVSIDFSKTVLSHSGTLRKVEVRQLNSVLNTLTNCSGKKHDQ